MWFSQECRLFVIIGARARFLLVAGNVDGGAGIIQAGEGAVFFRPAASIENFPRQVRDSLSPSVAPTPRPARSSLRRGFRKCLNRRKRLAADLGLEGP